MTPQPEQERIDIDILTAARLSRELGMPEYHGGIPPPLYFELHLAQTVVNLLKRIDALEAKLQPQRKAYMLSFNPLKSKTFWGAVVAAVSPIAIAYLNDQPLAITQVLQGLGLILAALGLRDAVAKV